MSNSTTCDHTLARWVERYPRLFVLTGAGCSTAAGLADYRDDNGEWKRKQPITGQAFRENTPLRKRYWARSAIGWPAFSGAHPAPAHEALARLHTAGVAPYLVTQNVDELHQKAGHPGVIDLHGVLSRVSCLACGESQDRDSYQQRLLQANPWLDDLSADFAPDGDADLETSLSEQMDVPACTQCGGMIKPDVVFFGENVPRERVDRAMTQLEDADALLVAGSSLMVFSGFRFCRHAAACGKPVIIVNRGVTRADDIASFKIDGDVGSRLQTLATMVTSTQMTVPD